MAARPRVPRRSALTSSGMTLPQSVRDDAAAVEAHLQTLFTEMSGPADRLAAAMRYATMNGGKRLRACLVMAAGRLAGGGEAAAGLIEVAAAVECLHAYSLIHDDLPAMDDSDTRAAIRHAILRLTRRPRSSPGMRCRRWPLGCWQRRAPMLTGGCVPRLWRRLPGRLALTAWQVVRCPISRRRHAPRCFTR